jgi:tol-pal system protein YbgF
MLVTEPARSLLGQSAVTVDLSARGSALLLAAVLLLGGCASVAEVTGTATQEELIRVRADLTRLQQSVQRLQGGVEGGLTASNSRAREQALQTEQQLGALSKRVEAMATSVTSLSTRVDELSSRLDSQARQSRIVPPAAPTRPAVVPPGVSPAPAPAPAPNPPPAASVSPGARPTPISAAPQDTYQAAYIDFSKGSYLIAITGFREFLRRYPDHPLAGSAQYWVGEAHLGIARGQANVGQAEKSTLGMEQAVQEFRKVVANYPRSDKAPSALYKEAMVLIELKQPTVAQARLQYLVDNFPQAEETLLAREKLAALKDR